MIFRLLNMFASLEALMTLGLDLYFDRMYLALELLVHLLAFTHNLFSSSRDVLVHCYDSTGKVVFKGAE
jgi:hypothetical protein